MIIKTTSSYLLEVVFCNYFENAVWIALKQSADTGDKVSKLQAQNIRSRNWIKFSVYARAQLKDPPALSRNLWKKAFLK